MSMLRRIVMMMTALFSPKAVKFDGANDYLSKASAIYSSTVSSGIFSAWVRFDGSPMYLLAMNDGTDEDFYFGNIWGDGSLSIWHRNSANTSALDLRTAAGRISLLNGEARWYHILASWDTNYGAGAKLKHLYVNDVSDNSLASDTGVAFTNSYATYTTVAIGSGSSFGSKHNGSLSELYFAPGQYLDFSVASNRRKFIDASGLPVALGADGSTPTGTAPAIYLRGDKTNFGTNSGTGGNFTVNGALETASSTPATLPAYNAVDFDGTNDVLKLAGNLTGLVDGKQGVLSFWFRPSGSSAIAFVVRNFNGYFWVRRLTTGVINIYGASSAPLTVLDVSTVNGYTDSPDWVHVLASWDLNTLTANIYVNGVLDTSVTSAVNGNIYYNTVTPAWAICGIEGAPTSNRFNGGISELYFAPNQYLDLSVQANREKFIKNGAPVSLGATGSLPTGTAPAIYLPNRAALVGTNAGTGGNFTINGAPKDANSTPLYYYAEPSKFDGSTTYLTRGAKLTGIADSYAGTCGFLFRMDASSAGTYVLRTDTGLLEVLLTSSNKMRFTLSTAGFTNYVQMETSVLSVSSVWLHILCAWSLNAASGARTTQMYVNNVSDKTLISDVGAAAVLIPLASDTNIAIGANTAGVNKLNACLADLWFNTTYLDISQASNRAKFIDQATLRPVSLGAKGELPTGTQPLLYLGRDYANFQTNLGSGGAFTVTGALTRGTTSASDVSA